MPKSRSTTERTRPRGSSASSDEHRERAPWRPDTVGARRMKPVPTPGEARFWSLVAPLLALPDVTQSTMMGLPCVRVRGSFFASCDRRNGDLLVKLREARVNELV